MVPIRRGWSPSGRRRRGHRLRETWALCVRRSPAPTPGQRGSRSPCRRPGLRPGRGGLRLLSLCPDGDTSLWSPSSPHRRLAGPPACIPRIPRRVLSSRAGPARPPPRLRAATFVCGLLSAPEELRATAPFVCLLTGVPAPRGSPELSSEGRPHAARSHNFPKGTVYLTRKVWVLHQTAMDRTAPFAG